MDSHKTGAFIAELRKEKDLTQTALAEKLNISNRTVSKWENGDGYPDITILPQIGEILGVTVDELLQGERKQAEEETPETLFDIEFTYTSKILRQGYYAYMSQKQSYITRLFALTALLFFGYTLTNTLFKTDSSRYFSIVYGVLFAALLFFWAYAALFGTHHIRSIKNYNGGVLCPTHVVFDSDGFRSETGSRSQEFNYSDISRLIVGKNVYVLKIHKRLIAITPRSALGNRQEEFEKFLRSVSPSTFNLNERSALRKIKNAAAIMLSVFAICSCCYIFYQTNSHYFYRDLNDKSHYFYQFKNEFNQGVRNVWADKELEKEVEEEGSAEYWAEDYLNLERINDVCITENSVAFMSYNNAEYYSAYVRYEGTGKPWVTALLFDNKTASKKDEKYIERDRVYLYGKTKNGTISNNNWYLVMDLGDNWYYVELHTKD